jgi:hypothetical protein
MQDGGGGGILGWLSSLFGNNSSNETDPGTEATRAVVENIKEMNKKIDETPKKAVKATEKFADVVSKTSTVGAAAGIVVTGVGVVTADPVVAAAGVEITSTSLTVGTAADVTSTVAKGADAAFYNGSTDAFYNQLLTTSAKVISGGLVNSATARVVTRTGLSNVVFRGASGKFISNATGYGVTAASDATKVLINFGF